MSVSSYWRREGQGKGGGALLPLTVRETKADEVERGGGGGLGFPLTKTPLVVPQ
jgi:hypothetical protein